MADNKKSDDYQKYISNESLTESLKWKIDENSIIDSVRNTEIRNTMPPPDNPNRNDSNES